MSESSNDRMTEHEGTRDCGEVGGGRDQSAELEPHEIHTLLGSQRRRIAIECVRDKESPIDLRELADCVATREYGEENPPSNFQKSVDNSLRQTHLPKLAERDIVECDDRYTEITESHHLGDVAIYFEVVPEHGLSWGEYYVGLSVLGALCVIGTHIGTPVLEWVSGSGWALVFFAALLVSALAQIAQQNQSLLDQF